VQVVLKDFDTIPHGPHPSGDCIELDHLELFASGVDHEVRPEFAHVDRLKSRRLMSFYAKFDESLDKRVTLRLDYPAHQHVIF